MVARHSSALPYGRIDLSVDNLIIATTWTEIADIIEVFFYFYMFCFPSYFKVFLCWCRKRSSLLRISEKVTLLHQPSTYATIYISGALSGP